MSGLGWTVLTVGLVCWFAGWRLGWVELMYIAAACLILFLLCGLLIVGRMNLSVRIEADPRRLLVGARGLGRVEVTNLSRGRLLPLALELPVGAAAAPFQLPAIAPGDKHEEIFIIPTERRGVIAIGPATTVRGDPFGLLRRSVTWTEMLEVFVHPITVPLESFGTGLLRDLEGQTTNDLSMSDLAFHTLREYMPGDDRRFIHWRSSAKVGSTQPGGKFLIRQFLDTRRSHLTVVVDSDARSYADPEDFETVVSVAASVAVRAIDDEMETTVIGGGQVADLVPRQLMLDALSRAVLGPTSLAELAVTGARVAKDTTVALLVTGKDSDFTTLRRAAMQFPSEATVLAIRVDPGQQRGMTKAGGLIVLSLSGLSDLAALLGGVSLQ